MVILWFVGLFISGYLKSNSRFGFNSLSLYFHRYELASEDLAFQEGFIFRSTTYVPLNRIQHIETEQGPFLRHENLMELVIYTAATKHKILGLDVDEAQQLRAQIIEMVRQAKEDV